MSLGLAFWLLMLIALVSGVLLYWPQWPQSRYGLGAALLYWLLLACLGWQVFGPALRA